MTREKRSRLAPNKLELLMGAPEPIPLLQLNICAGTSISTAESRQPNQAAFISDPTAELGLNWLDSAIGMSFYSVCSNRALSRTWSGQSDCSKALNPDPWSGNLICVTSCVIT